MCAPTRSGRRWTVTARHRSMAHRCVTACACACAFSFNDCPRRYVLRPRKIRVPSNDPADADADAAFAACVHCRRPWTRRRLWMYHCRPWMHHCRDSAKVFLPLLVRHPLRPTPPRHCLPARLALGQAALCMQRVPKILNLLNPRAVAKPPPPPHRYMDVPATARSGARTAFPPRSLSPHCPPPPARPGVTTSASILCVGGWNAGRRRLSDWR